MTTIGVFVSSVDIALETMHEDDPYLRLLCKTVADRMAEAAAEEAHWRSFQLRGIRPAVGYPSMPDMGMNFLLDHTLTMSRIGVSLTESGAMRPHASVSGLILPWPKARYFSVGRIGLDQLTDYARRRQTDVATMRKFLARNLE